MKPLLVLAGTLALAGCGSADRSANGVTVPTQFAGTWSSDCTTPYVTFADTGMTIHPDGKRYALKTAELNGTQLAVSYVNPDVPGTLTDTYAVEGDTLRLATTSLDGKVVGTWTKRPMTRCP